MNRISFILLSLFFSLNVWSCDTSLLRNQIKVELSDLANENGWILTEVTLSKGSDQYEIADTNQRVLEIMGQGEFLIDEIKERFVLGVRFNPESCEMFDDFSFGFL